jgi:uncharacterized membrane protein YpjA
VIALDNRDIIKVFILINLLGTLAGFVYYENQFAATPMALWLFVSDCPNYTLLFGIALMFLLMGKRYHLYYYIVSVGTAKYGFWTLFAILFYRDYFLSPRLMPLYASLFASHFAMMLQPVVVLHKVKVEMWYILPALGWFLLNDYMDYAIGVHPYVPNRDLDILMWATVGMSVGVTALMYYLVKKVERPVLFDY